MEYPNVFFEMGNDNDLTIYFIIHYYEYKLNSLP